MITKCELKVSDKSASLYLYGDIGDSLVGEGITASQVKEELDKAKGPLSVYINSPGGQVFEGLAIHSLLSRYEGGKVTCVVDGMAASIASVIAMAGSKVKMMPGAMMMVHEPHGVFVGNAADLRKAADDLEVVSATIRGLYMGKSGMEEPACRAMMATETWLTGEDAVKCGLADEMMEETKPQKRMAAHASLLDTYKNTPEKLRTTPSDLAIARMKMALTRQTLCRRAHDAGGKPGQPGKK